jgi:hypothetical protein
MDLPVLPVRTVLRLGLRVKSDLRVEGLAETDQFGDKDECRAGLTYEARK